MVWSLVPLRPRVRVNADPPVPVSNYRRRSLTSISLIAAASLLISIAAIAPAAADEAPGAGQADATVRGRIVDASGASVGDARVSASTGTGREAGAATTSADGTYALTSLPAGIYTIVVSRAGFQTQRLTVTLRAGDARVLDLSLVVSGVNEQIAVVGQTLATEQATATKSDAPLLETPASVSVVTSAEIEARGVTSVPQALRYATAIVPESRGAMTALDYMYSRGFLVNQYQDGLRLLSGGYSIPQLDPALLDRVELLRGPASVLYGQADPGGVLNLATKQATGASIREVTFQVGSHDRVQAGFDVGGRVGDSTSLAYRIAGTAHAADTQVDHAHDRRVAFAPSLRWQPDQATTLVVSAAFQRDPAVGFYNWIPAYGSVLPNPADPSFTLPTSFDAGDPSFDEYSRTLASFSAQYTRRLNQTWTIRGNLRQGHVSSAFDKIYSSYLDEDGRTLYRYAWHLRDHVNALTFDSQAEATLTSGRVRHTLLVGADYQHGWYHQALGYNFDAGVDPGQVPPLDLLDPVYDQSIDTPPLDNLTDQRQNQFGLYAQDRVSIGPWRVLLGGRHDWTSATTIDLSSGDSLKQPDRASTGRAGVVYLTPSGLAPYASVSQSFQPTSGVDFDGNPFKPTTGLQYEGGVKYGAMRGLANVTFAVYQLAQQNVLSNDPIHPGESVQTGEIRSRGIEISEEARVNDALAITATYSHSSTVVTKAGVAFGPEVGMTPSGLPKDLASVWVSYVARGSRAAGLGLAGGVRVLGSSWDDDANSFDVPDATLVDLALSYDFGAAASSGASTWRAALNVSNLFDKTYVASCGGDSFCAYGFRRTLLATIGRQW
jgi:iron complex outermembrane receptor protein